MLNLTRPRYVMPVHGDHRRLRLHADLAEAVGIDPERIFQGRNGVALEIDEYGARLGARRTSAGMIFVDGVDIGDPDDVALRDRRDAVGRRRVHRRRHGLLRRRLAGRRRRRSSSAACRSSRRRDGLVEELREVVERLARRGRQARGARAGAAPAGPARRHRRVRLRAPAPPADGPAGGRRGLSRRGCYAGRDARRARRQLSGRCAGSSARLAARRDRARGCVAALAAPAPPRDPAGGGGEARGRQRAAARARTPVAAIRCRGARPCTATSSASAGVPVLDARRWSADPRGAPPEPGRRLDRSRHRPPDPRRDLGRARRSRPPAQRRASSACAAPARRARRSSPATAARSCGGSSLPAGRAARPTSWSGRRRTGETRASRDRACASADAATRSIYNPNPVVEQGGYSGPARPQGQGHPAADLAAPAGHASAASGAARVPARQLGPRQARPRRRKRSATGPRLHGRHAVERPLRGPDGLLPHRPRPALHPDASGSPKPLRRQAAEGASPTRSRDDNSFFSPPTHEIEVRHRRRRRRRGRRRDRARVRPLAPGPGRRRVRCRGARGRRSARASATTWPRRCRP